MEYPPELQAAQAMPHSNHAEISVLGSMLLDPSALDLAIEGLFSEDFYSTSHQDIFACMCSLREKGAPVDAMSLTVELDKMGKLNSIGGTAYIAELTIQTPSSSNVEHYVSVVAERSQQRQLLRAGNAIAKDARDTTRNIEDVLNDAERRIFDVTMKRTTDTLMPARDIVRDAYMQIGERQKTKGKTIGVPTGFHDLDRNLSGLKRSDLIIVAGRPAMGKTSFALNIAQHAAMNKGFSVVVFSLEMSREQLIMRMFSTATNLDMKRMLNGDVTHDEMTVILTDALVPLSNSRLYIDDSAAATVPEIRSKCRRLKAKEGLDLVVIDYLQLMRSSKKTDNRQQEISDITRSLKILARELDVPIVLLSQLSRAPETRKDRQDGHRPMLSDLRESGAIEQDADVVILLYRDEVYNEGAGNIAEAIVAKHRNGPTCVVKLAWRGEFTKFMSLMPDELHE